MPARKKPAGRAVDKRNGHRGKAVLGTAPQSGHQALQQFDPPSQICAEAKRQWEAYWEDHVSRAPTLADRGLLLRWVDNVNRYLKATVNADESPLVLGSQEQSVINPLYKVAEMALAEVIRCEKQLGIGAKNRADLGLAIVAEQKSLADLNADYYEESAGDDSDQDEAAEDPRLEVVRGEVV